MTPDYDLSNLPASHVDLWVYLRVDAIFDQIMADQAARLGFSLAPRDCTVAAPIEKPPPRLNRVQSRADRRARLRNQNWED